MSPRVVLVVAMAENRVIGAGGAMPWHIPSDLKRFKALTIGKPVIMGRKTWESIGKPLVDRDNIVVTRQPDFAPKGAIIAGDIEHALIMGKALAEGRGASEITVIGGGEIYRQIMDRADRIEMTLVKGDVAGDTYFPDYDSADWEEVSREEAPRGEKDSHPVCYVTLIRR
jgi:dihydrofolate reductase